MIELTRHIEYLLLENDCVVIPSLGGFIAHYQPAHYEESEGIFLPPMRTIGFNPQLTMNDGLLVQSYMQTYHTDFSDATKRIEDTIEKMKEQLYSEGIIDIHNIGTLRYNIYGSIEFEPCDNGVISPSLYGLDCFSITPLQEKCIHVETDINKEATLIPAQKSKYIQISSQWIGNVAAIAIAFILFFALSVPVENTYIDKGSYASLGTECLFDAIRSHSMATTLNVTTETSVVPQQQDRHAIKPVAVKVEKVAPATPKVETKSEAKIETKTEMVPASSVKATKATPVKTANKVTKQSKLYHIIVASLTTSTDANQTLKDYKNKGYEKAKIIEGNGRYRISLCNYTDKNTAYNKLNELKQNDAFKNAWLLTSL